MDEQRFATYLNLVEQLVECPNGGENDILNANRELVDADLLQVIEMVAADMAEKGNSNTANFLHNQAAQLANFIGNTATSEEYLLFFLMEVLQSRSESEGDPQFVYPILQQNLDKLNLKFAEILQIWATSKFTEVTSEQAAVIATVIGRFGNLIEEFTLGRRDWNLEIGIACYQSALMVHTPEQFPQEWAMTQNNLGIAYRERIQGEKAQNIEQAIACYQSALTVYSLEQFPQDWAMTQYNLGNAYIERIHGKKAQNIEQAIACYQSALIVYSLEQFPQYWAMTQHNWGNAYCNRIQGEKAENIEQAIACYQSALIVYTREQFPQEWATTQYNLGIAYRNRIQGEKAENIEQAIACYQSALIVRTPEQFPQEWAATQYNLGSAYTERIQGEKAENIELTIACYQSALIVRTLEQFPQQWAANQNNLGIAYRNRIQGEKAENIEQAIACYQSALIVRTPEQFPEEWAATQDNLGSAYIERIQGEKAENIEQAIACYQSALIVRTPEQFPQEWATTQLNWGNAYIERIQGEKTQNREQAIACYQSALIVYTREQFPQYWAMTQNNLGIAYRERIQGEKAQNIEQAIAFYQSALTVYSLEQFPQEWATTQHNLGIAYSERIQGEKAQNIEQAIAFYQSALIVYTPTAFPLKCLGSSRSLGYTAFTAGFWEIAIEGYDRAMTAVEQSRSWVTSDERRQQMVAQSIDVYENAIQACVNSGQLEKAIEYCDRTRSKHLVDLMHSNDVYASGKIPPEVDKYLREFEAKQQEIDAEVEQLRNPSPGNKVLATAGSQLRNRADFAACTNKIEQLEAEKQHIWENIRRLDPVLSGQLQVDGMKFEAMQQLINNLQTAIICFYTTNEDTHVFVIYKDKPPQIHTCQGEGWATFQQWIRESWLLPYLVAKKSWKRGMGDFLNQLSQRLKVNELIDRYLDGIEELIVIPHLFLHQIPLAALPVGGNGFFGDKFLMRYVPSCKILEYCHQRPTIASPQYGIVENATDDLYFTPFECEEITKIVPVKQHLKGRQQATVANYRDLVKQVNVLHSSHHAKSRLDNPLESELLLGDGTIRLGELMTPGWRLPELSDVFLSCCETNLGETKITDDLLTLGTGFLCAGARSVVSTLWAVNDLATSFFSIFYYQFRQAGCSRPDALRRAQVRLQTISGAQLEVLYKSQIDAIQIKGLESRAKSLYAMPNPFADLIYWSGFICQGLH